MTSFRHFLLLSLIFAISNSIDCQNKILSLGSEDILLPSNTAFFHQTNDGMYWLGGSTGITRFDGRNSRKYNFNDSSSDFVHDQNIQSGFYPDSSGLIWFTSFSGLHNFDSKTRAFHSYQLKKGGKFLTEDYRIFHIDQEKKQLLLRAGKTLWRYHLKTNEYSEIAHPTTSIKYAISPDNKFIVGARWDTIVEIFTSDSNNDLYQRNTIRLPYEVYDVTYSQEDSIAFLGTEIGLGKLSLTYDSITYELLDPGSTRQAATSLTLTKDGSKIYFCSNGNGVVKYNIEASEINRLDSLNKSLSTRKAMFLGIDEDQNIWIPQKKGSVDIVYDSSENFRNLILPFENTISDLGFSSEGHPLILTEAGELWDTYEERNLFADYKKVPTYGKLYSSKEESYIFSLFGIWKQSDESKKWNYFPFGSPQNMYGIQIQENDENIIRTDAGISEFNLSSGKYISNPLLPFSEYSTADFGIIHPLSKNEFIISYKAKEVWVCSIDSTNLISVESVPLIGDISGVTKTNEDSIYIASSTGVYVIDQGVTRKNFTGMGDLKNVAFESISSTANGDLWLGTRFGLFNFNPALGDAKYYSTVDGLISNQFIRIDPLNHPNGEIWMATDKGLVIFHPDSLSSSKDLPATYINELWINDIPVPDSLIRDTIVVDYRHNTLNFELSSTGLFRSPLFGIEYQLIGYDDRPIFAKPGSNVRYPKLPHGRYNLQLTAINRNGLPAESKFVFIRVKPPFYLTWPFIILMCLLAAGSLVFARHLVIAKERRRQNLIREREKQIAEERDRIAGEVHDDLGGELASIQYISEELVLAGHEDQEQLSRINELAKQSIRTTREIIFVLDDHRGNIEALVRQIEENGAVMLGDWGIDFEASEDLGHPQFELSSRQKRNLSLIFKEAFNNVRKYADANLVTLHSGGDAKELIIILKDDGKGFDPCNVETSRGGFGRGLSNMREKAAAIGASLTIDSTPGAGTTIKLHWEIPVNV